MAYTYCTLYITILNIIILFSLGFVTDGEFNSLRTKGEKRPLHVVELIRDARNSVSSKSGKTLLKLLVRTEGNSTLYL
jgi:hypothetical protein